MTETLFKQRVLPPLFRRHGWNPFPLDRDPQAAEALDERGFFAECERALEVTEVARTDMREIKANQNLSSSGIRRLIAPIKAKAGADMRAIVNAALAALARDARKAADDLEAASRPTVAGAGDAIVHELRVGDALRQLEGFSLPDRVVAVLSAAGRGDMYPLLGAERSYSKDPFVPEEVRNRARRAFAEATARPVAESADFLKRQEVLADRVASEVLARGDSDLNVESVVPDRS